MGRLSREFPTAQAVDAALKRANKAEADMINLDAEVAGKVDYSDFATKTQDLQEQINNIVAEASESGDVSYEVAQARVGADGTNYDTLKERLDIENHKITACLDTLSDFNNSPFNDGSSGYKMPMIKIGMVNAQTGEIEPATGRAYSDLVDIGGRELYLLMKISNYATFKFGVACYNASGNHLGNVGYFAEDKNYSDLRSGTAKIRLVFMKNDATAMTTTDIEWLNKNAFIEYGRYMPDTTIKFHYSTITGGGNSYEKYAFLGFDSSDKSNVVLNPTGKIVNLGLIFKGKRYVDNISNYSLDLTYCSTNDNKLIYLDPIYKKFYVCDGLAPENYKSLVDNCAFVGFICIPIPQISNTLIQMSVDGNNVNPYYGEYDDQFADNRNEIQKSKTNLTTLSNFNTSPFNDGNSGFAMPLVNFGMVNAQTGEIEKTNNRAYSNLVDISGKELHLTIKISNYSDFKIGVACYDSSREHLGNVGYYTNDVYYSNLLQGTAKIRLVFAKNDSTEMTTEDLNWLNANSFVQYGNFMLDTTLKFHYSTLTGGGNAYDKYAFLGFSSSNKASVTLNPTGQIANLGVVFKGKRYLDSISNFSLDLTHCGTNDNKLIYLDPISKKFYVCDGLAPENYKSVTDNCAFVGFVCIPAPSISSTSMQMSVNGVNVNPYYGEYKSHFNDLDGKTKIFSEFHYSLDTANSNCLDAVPLLEFSSSNKASVTLSTRMDRFTICVAAKTYSIKLSDITLDTSNLSTGDNKLIYLDVDTKTLYVFDGTNPASNSAKSAGFTFLGLVCIPIPEVSICKIQMSVDGRNLMMSRGAELASVRFQNKSFSVIGDSISRYDGSWGGEPAGTQGWGGDTYKNAGYPASSMWWHRLARATGMSINTINANAGSCCSTGNPSRIAGCSDQRTSALDNGTNPDYIICEMGTNDFLYGVDLGSYDGTTDVPSDVSTFMGAYSNMLKKIQTNYPYAKIYCCTIHQHTHESYVTLRDNLPVIVNRDGITLRDYNNAIREIAKLFGCGVIDFESCGLNIRNVADLTFDDSTTMHLHPTGVGQNMLGEAAISAYR